MIGAAEALARDTWEASSPRIPWHELLTGLRRFLTMQAQRRIEEARGR